MKNLLHNQGLTEKSVEDLERSINCIGIGEFISPLAWSAKNKIDISLANKIFLVLAMDGFLDIYTIPEFNENLMFEYAQKGIIADPKNFEVLDPADFQTIESDELKLVNLYLKHSNE